MEKQLVLSNSHNAKSFANNENEFLQVDAFSKVCRLVENLLSLEKNGLLSDDDAFYEARGHYSILINGKRGSGKTTFALTATKLLEAGQTKVVKNDRQDSINKAESFDIKKGEILNLGILDPTLIDSKEHVLLAVIAKIKEKVDSHYKHKVETAYDSNSIFTKYSHPLDEWRNALSNLAKGLQQLDGVGNNSMQDSIWEDSLTIMEEGLVAISSGLALNRRLHIFIEQSLKLLEAKAFILVLDDIDTFFEKGWPVLEALRKYLTSPQLLTLVCGDLQLYQSQVQRQQWQQLGDLATKFETDTKSRANHEAMIYALTEQYLLKVLPANRRVELAVVVDIDAVKVYQDSDRQANDNDAPTLKDRIDNMLRNSYQLASDTVEGRLFYNFIARRPLRITIQLLQSLKGNELPVDALQNIFADWVYQQGASKLLQKSDSNPLLIQQLLVVLHTSGLMQDNLELLPHYDDDSRNAGAAVASRLLCSYFKSNPGMALDFMVRGGLSRQAVYFSGVSDRRPSDENIMRALAATTSDDLLTVTRQWSPVVVHGLSDASKYPIHLGTVQILTEGAFLSNRSQRALKNLYRTTNPNLVRAYADTEKNADSILKNSTLEALASGMSFLRDYYEKQKTREVSKHYAISPLELQSVLRKNQQPELAQLAGLLFVVVSEGNNNFNRASALNLIGFLSKLINLASSTKEDNIAFKDLISHELKRAGQIRTYPVPVDFSLFGTKENYDEVNNTEDEEPELQNDDEEQLHDGKDNDDISSSTCLVNALAKWLNNWKVEGFSGLDYPPYVWSRIWQRFYYTLEQQDKTYKPQHRFLGIIIHRQIIGFLNAVLVEELRHKKDMAKSDENAVSISLNNPVLADDIYINNLKKLIKADFGDKKSVLPLYQKLADCPLWEPFLQDSLCQEQQLTENDKRYSSYLEGSNNIKLADLLNLVAPARGDDNSIPTLWSHDVIQQILLKNDEIQSVLKDMLASVPLEEKSLAAFVREHLSRTSNPTIVKALKALKADK